MDAREAEGRWQHLITKVKMGMVTTVDSRVKVAIRIVGLTEIPHWLVYHGYPRSAIDWHSTKFFLDLYDRRVLGQGSRRLT